MPENADSFHWTVLRVGSLRECLDAWQASPLFAKLDESFRHSSCIVLDEVGSNFLRFSGAKAKEMKVNIAFDGDEMTITFDDDGAEFNPTKIPPPPRGNLALLPPGGRGLYMARQSVDSWTHRRENDRNINVLTKRVKNTADAGEPAADT